MAGMYLTRGFCEHDLQGKACRVRRARGVGWRVGIEALRGRVIRAGVHKQGEGASIREKAEAEAIEGRGTHSRRRRWSVARGGRGCCQANAAHWAVAARI